MTYDLATPAGLAATTIAVLELCKVLVTYEIKQKKWYGASVNLSALIIAFGLSMATIPMLGIEFNTAIGNGIIGALSAIGIYEPLTNTYRGIFKK